MGQQWTRSLEVAATSKDPATKNRIEFKEKDALALCEDGDLLLMREQVTHVGMRVVMNPTVARDIALMQHGHFPTQRVTSLPGVCVRESDTATLTTIHNVLVCVVVFALLNGWISLDEYAIRRLQRARSPDSAEFFRSLVFEITTLVPLQWHSFRSSGDGEGLDATNAKSPKRWTPLVGALFKRMLQLFHRSIERAQSVSSFRDQILGTQAVDTKDSREPASSRSQDHQPPQPSPRCRTPDAENHSTSFLRFNLAENTELLDRVDVNGILSASFVAAVYEHIGVLPPPSMQLASDTTRPLTPAFFWTGSKNTERSSLTPATSNALGDEMYIAMED